MLRTRFAGKAGPRACVALLGLGFLVLAPAAGAVTNGKLVFHSPDGTISEVTTINPDGTGRTALTSNSDRDEGAQFSPDGTKIAFGSNRPFGGPAGRWQIYVMNADGSGVVRISDGTATDTTPTWSPDGTKIAFTRGADIYLMNADGTGVAAFTSTAASEDWASWSPDGTRIAFTSNRDGDNEIYVQNIATGGVTQLTTNTTTSDHDPDWSPDGTKIAYSSDPDGGGGTPPWTQVWTMNADGTGQVQISDSSAPGNFSADAAWAPDGTRIAFAFSPGGSPSFDIWTMNADGTGRVNVTSNSQYDGFPDWQAISDTLLVNTTGDTDDGVCNATHCALREAINAANATPGTQTIAFAIGAGGAQTIAPTSALPAITQTVAIDGTTQPGFIGPPLIEVDGASAGAGVTGLTLSAANSTIRALAVNRFSGQGIAVTGSDNTLRGNYVGVDLAGIADRGNALDGIRITGARNTIGGTAAGSRNVISGNDRHGIFFQFIGATGNVVAGNYIGTDASGAADLGNGNEGVVFNLASTNTVGGTTPAERNVISGNGAGGVHVAGNTGNKVRGNYIGTNSAGTGAIPNSNGVIVDGANFDVAGTEIGSDLSGAGNVISGNTSNGVFITGGQAPGRSSVSGNLIGLNAAGSAALPNGGAGVQLFLGPTNVTVGGTASGAGNTIASNGGDGVFVDGAANTGNTVVGNAIHSNGGLGIDLAPNGVTANDAGDGDAGANDLQNFPVLTSAEASGGSIAISGTLSGSASTTYRFEFFRGAGGTCDPSGNGEGATFLGSALIGSDPAGTVVFTSTFPVAVAAGEQITATATNPAGSTSEFSVCRTATAAAAATFTVNSSADTNDGACTTANCTLREAINAANAASGTQTISFNITPSGSHTITPGSGLPPITGQVLIDGTTQPGFTGAPVIELDGASSAGAIGLSVAATAAGSTIRGLAVNQFSNGLDLSGNGNKVEGSYVGLGLGGTTGKGNTNVGILVRSGTGTVIGGTTAAARNVVSGNFNGILISSGFSVDATGTLVQGNYIGTNAAGTSAVPNTAQGVYVNSGAQTIGGAAPGAGNLISGNSTGVRLGSSLTTGTVVAGNTIGLGSGGELVPNSLPVVVFAGASANTIGGTAASAGNTIRSNTENGVLVVGDTTRTNRILGNSISANGQLGIDLGGDGVTPNDPLDADGRSNDLQNFPVLSSATLAGSTLTVDGDLDSKPDTAYRIELFLSTACDGSGNGEGATFLGAISATTTPTGDATFSTSLPIGGGGASAPVVTATATDPDGNTSEFSPCKSATAGGALRAMVEPADCVSPDALGRTVSFEEPGTGALAERYAALGLHFVDSATSTPTLFSNTDLRQTSSNPNSLRNTADDVDGGPGGPLTITFDEAQSRVGFFIGNGFSELGPTATLTAYGVEDVVLGTLTKAVTSNDVAIYFGAIHDAGGIRKLTLDYGSSFRGEEIDDICFTAADPTGEPPTEGVVLTVDQGSIPAGVQTAALGAVPANQLPSLSGAPNAAPVGSIPVGSIPVGSIPVGSIPVGSIPVGSIPVGSIPVGSIGLNSVPVGSINLGDVLLSSLPIDWDAILPAELEDRPLQALTLADVYANASARIAFEALTLAQSGLNQSFLANVSLAAILLGEKKLSQLPAPEASSWCAAITEAGGSCNGVSTSTNTVLGLSVAGIPVGSIPVGSIPVGSIAGGIAGTPVGSIPVGSIDIAATRLASIKLDFANADTVVDCPARIACTSANTLGDAAALSPSAIRPNVPLSALQAVLGNITLGEIIIGILPRSSLAWEGWPIDGFQLFAGTGKKLNYHADFDLDCSNRAGLAITVKLPDGFVYEPGSTTFEYGTALPIAGPNPTTGARLGARWTGLPGSPCPTGVPTQHIRMNFRALAGLTLGIETASAKVSSEAGVKSADDQAPVQVLQNWEANDDPATGPTILKDQLVVGHIAKSGDREIFKVAIPARGARTTVYLSHVPEGADFDLVVGKPATESLQSNPVGSIPVGSIPIEDNGSGPDDSETVLPPETLQDIPVGSIPVGSISANRGNASEVGQLISQGESGVYTIAVSGYNGSHSDEPFVLRVKVDPPPELPNCPARSFSGAPGTPSALPGSLPAGTKTLFLVNRTRMNALYGDAAATTAMRTALDGMLARPEIQGQVLEVDGSSAVRAAYTAWDASPCSVGAANNVVRAINDVVAGYRPSLPNLKYIVLLGTDDAIPLARVLDEVEISPESDEASELAFTLGSPARGNPLYAAAATSHFLTDNAYVAFTEVPWLGRQLYLPQISASRLVETPLDIQKQIEVYVAANGLLDPASAFTTAYDFLLDGGEGVKSGLDTLVGAGSTGALDDNWGAAAVTSKLAAPDDVLSLNAHYSHYLLQPASGTALVRTSNLPAIPVSGDPVLARRILFTMGCHGGLNIPNTYTTAAPLPEGFLDWTEGYARQRAAVYVANNGFGYGDTLTNALSERLMTIFARNLNVQGTIGDSWVRSVHEYWRGAGAYPIYDEKALTEANMFGFPFWRIQDASAPAAPMPPALTPDPVSGLQVAPISVNLLPLLDPKSDPARGRWWEIGGNTLDVHYRPIQPRLERDVTVPGMTARGVIIRSLVTDDEEGVDPAKSLPTIDQSDHEPERKHRDTVFPANLVNLTRSIEFAADRQGLVVNAGQFRPATPPGATGIERLVHSIGVEIAYASGPGGTSPRILQVSSVFAGGQANIMVQTAGPAKRVAALFNDGSSNWQFKELSETSSNFWTGIVAAGGPVEVYAQAQAITGEVGYSANKGFNFTSVTAATDPDGPDILLESPASNGEYTLGQTVTASYACSDVAGVASCTGPVPSGGAVDTSTPGMHTFTVTASDSGGRQSTLTHTYFVRYAFSRFFSPVDNPPTLNRVTAGRTVPVKWQLKNAAGQFIRSLAVVTAVATRRIDCPNAPTDEVEQTEPATGSALTYDTAAEQFHYQFRTQRSWAGTCRRLTIELNDGTKPFADFSFR